MTHRRSFKMVVVLAAAFMAGPLALAENQPDGVSPGALDRLPAIEGRCPTFSWVELPGAASYELVVYELWDRALLAAAATHDLDLERTTEVLYTRVPGGASSWTPSLEQCLVAGAGYVWFVRAVFDGEAGEASEWSEPMLFEVAAAPTADELERAIEVLRRWEAANGDGSLMLSSVAAPAVASVPDSGSGSGSGSSHPKSILTGVAAIRGSQPDATGETYGVVGSSASPDGAGIGAVNTAGGPDLVLDGSLDGVVDAEFSESGIDRSSPSAQTFSIDNTGGGGISLEVGGVEVVTEATDADTLAGLTCAGGEIARWNGSSWVCSADIDTDTDTLAALGPVCDSGEIASWNGSAWVCAEDADTLGDVRCPPFFTNRVPKWNGSQWSCGQDDDTTYSFGPGLIIENGHVAIDPAAFSRRISVLNSAGNVGRYSSLSIGSDGLGLVSYYDWTDQDLMVSHCEDRFCSRPDSTTMIDTDGNVGAHSSLAVGADGLGLIAYSDRTNDDLKVAHCVDISCTSATITTLDSANSVGDLGISLDIGADGLGLISYYDSTNSALKVAHCDNVSCTSATLSTLDSDGIVGRYSSLAIGADGLGLITYHDLSSSRIKVAHCDDLSCTSAALTTLWFPVDSSVRSTLAIGSDGLGLISWGPGYSMYFFHCDDVECSSFTLSAVGDYYVVEPSLVIGIDGLPMLSFQSGVSENLAVARCDDVMCSTALVTTVDDAGDVGQESSIAIGTDARGLVSYYDQTNQNLKVVHLPFGL